LRRETDILGRETAILAEARLFCCVMEGIGEQNVWICAMKLKTKHNCRLTVSLSVWTQGAFEHILSFQLGSRPWQEDGSVFWPVHLGMCQAHTDIFDYVRFKIMNQMNCFWLWYSSSFQDYESNELHLTVIQQFVSRLWIKWIAFDWDTVVRFKIMNQMNYFWLGYSSSFQDYESNELLLTGIQQFVSRLWIKWITFDWDIVYIYRGADKFLTQVGNNLQRKKILSFIYPVFNQNWRNISIIYIYIYI
jgi:hypothetical protein